MAPPSSRLAELQPELQTGSRTMKPTSGPEPKLETDSGAMEPLSRRLAELQPELQTCSRMMEQPRGPELKRQIDYGATEPPSVVIPLPCDNNWPPPRLLRVFRDPKP